MTAVIIALLLQIADSGRVATIAETPSERITRVAAIAPGQPPLISFRYFEGKDRRRFSGLDLVLDDAGH